MPTHDCVLLGDIGATNARFALLRAGRIGPVQIFQVAQHRTFIEVVDHFIAQQEGSRPARALFAVAAPIKNGRAVMTNASWSIDSEELHDKLKVECHLVNDFEAVAMSLPVLEAKDLAQVGPGAPAAMAQKAVLGPGSGLGIAGLVFKNGKATVVSSEGGHTTLAATDEREFAVVKVLQERFGHVSFERAVSGPGLENIDQALEVIDGKSRIRRSAAEITQRALAGDCPTAVEALSLFCKFLGSFAGNAALTFAAKGGVYIAGGISPRIVQFLSNSEFRRSFEAKGRFQEYLATIPTYVIVHPAAAFVGLKSLVDS